MPGVDPDKKAKEHTLHRAVRRIVHALNLKLIHFTSTRTIVHTGISCSVESTNRFTLSDQFN